MSLVFPCVWNFYIKVIVVFYCTPIRALPRLYLWMNIFHKSYAASIYVRWIYTTFPMREEAVLVACLYGKAEWHFTKYRVFDWFKSLIIFISVSIRFVSSGLSLSSLALLIGKSINNSVLKIRVPWCTWRTWLFMELPWFMTPCCIGYHLMS